MTNQLLRLGMRVFIPCAVFAFSVAVHAQHRWVFNEESGTLGWTGAGINWLDTSSGWTSSYKMNGFKAHGETVISDGMLSSNGFYMASPTSFTDWGRYAGGSLNIVMTEKTGGEDYHQTDGILSGGVYTYPGGTESSGFHEYQTLPYVFMQTQLNGEDIVLAAQLLYTEGSGEYSITLDQDSWMVIDIAYTMSDWPGGGETVTISGSFLSQEDYLEALNNAGGIFIRSEFNYIGDVGSGGMPEYLTQISEIYLNMSDIPEPGTVAVFAGIAALVLAVYRRRVRN